MGVATSLLALSGVLDPRLASWSVLMRSGKVWSEHSLVPTLKKGVRGVRLLDWGEDIVTTGDVYRVKEIRLHPPIQSRMPVAVLEILDGQEPFEFKVNTLDMIGADGVGIEYMVVGRTVDKGTAHSQDAIKCECFIWDYRPLPERQYKAAKLHIPGQPATEAHAAIPEQLAEPEETYRPAGKNLIAYKSTIGNFGGWRDTVTPMGRLSTEVQGFRL
jgi:hypothetical protein